MPFPIRPDALWATARINVFESAPGVFDITALRTAGVTPASIAVIQTWAPGPPAVPAILELQLSPDAQLDPVDAIAWAENATPISVPGPSGVPLVMVAELLSDTTIRVFIFDPGLVQPPVPPLAFTVDLLIARLF